MLGPESGCGTMTSAPASAPPSAAAPPSLEPAGAWLSLLQAQIATGIVASTKRAEESRRMAVFEALQTACAPLLAELVPRGGAAVKSLAAKRRASDADARGV